MKVLIATKNQGKIEGSKKALEHYFIDVEIPVESNVPDQPLCFFIILMWCRYKNSPKIFRTRRYKYNY